MTQENQLQISLNEATQDYIKAFTEYERYRKFYKNDCDVYKSILHTHFPMAEITLSGTLITITIHDYSKQILSNVENKKELDEKLSQISDDVSFRVHCVNDSLFILVRLPE